VLPGRAHGRGRGSRGDREQTIEIRKGQIDFDPELDALLTRARPRSDVGYAIDEVWQAARPTPGLDAEWRDTALTEVSVPAAFNLVTHHVNPLRRDRPGLPTAPALRPGEPAGRRKCTVQ
jgi:hypothetical protein